MKKRSGIYIVGGIVLCIALLFLAYVGLRLTQGGERPVVFIQSPSSNLILDSGEGLAVVVYAESDAGLEKISLYVDGELYAEETGANENSLTVVFPWYAEKLGGHTLEVKAVDRFNRPSDPVQLMVGVEASKPDTMDYEYVPTPETVDDGGTEAAGSIVPAVNGDRVIVSEDGSFGVPPTDEEVMLLPHADDVNPSITLFTAEPGRNGHQVQIRYRIEAEDDLGIDRFELSASNTTTGETSPRTTLCFGEPVCVVEDVYPFASAGAWLFQVQAIDTSGQSSVVQTTAVEIVENPGFEPAIGILDPAVIDRLITNWMRDDRPRTITNLEVFEPIIIADLSFPAGALEDIQMELTPGYALMEPIYGFPPGMVRDVVQVRSVIPPIAAWGGYDNLVLVIKVDSQDLPDNERGERFPLRGNPTTLTITDEIIANGYVFETAVWARCGGLNWDVHWELFWNGQLIESGPIFTVRTAPCLPPPSAAPIITSLQGYSNSEICGNASACTVLTWQASGHPEPTDPTVELPMTSLGVYRWAPVAIGRLDALGANPDDFLRETFWYVTNDNEFTQRMPCAPPETILTYAFTLVPMTYIGPGESIYSNDGSTLAHIEACKTLPYNEIGGLQPR
ncbi:MAG: hypothetical protein H6635_09735 [Anaerolineales bacterium]|nr:hypothetical protein [Anaerolineales bacterium]MCB9145639.1 hypothetical protein [Anaerolineales bacterium]